MNWRRLSRHLLTPQRLAGRHFTPLLLDRIENAIAAGEARHGAEVCLAVESCLDLRPLWRDQSPRERAIDVFGLLRVWDTPTNNGVLLYLLLADHDIEIVADRGVAERVGDASWLKVCRAMETRLRRRDYAEAALLGVAAVNELLIAHLPKSSGGESARELPDRPAIL